MTTGKIYKRNNFIIKIQYRLIINKVQQIIDQMLICKFRHINQQLNFSIKYNYISMLFSFSIQQLFGIDDTIIVLGTPNSIQNSTCTKIIDIKRLRYQQPLQQIINQIGKASSLIQQIKNPITTYDKFIVSQDRIYLKVYKQTVIGFLKVGKRTLYYFNNEGNKRLQPICVLDFYITEDLQRKGYGKELFQYFLENEHLLPHKLAYDRPSVKLLTFLFKNYYLKDYLSQTNNFVIFNEYFNPSFQYSTTLLNKHKSQQLDKHQDKLYQQAQQSLKRRQNQQREFIQNNNLFSSKNQFQNNYKSELQQSSMNSFKTNNMFKSILALSQNHENPIFFGYSNKKSKSPQNFKQELQLRRNAQQMYESEIRKKAATNDLQRLQYQIKILQNGIKKSINFGSKTSSTEYGKYLKRI